MAKSEMETSANCFSDKPTKIIKISAKFCDTVTTHVFWVNFSLQVSVDFHKRKCKPLAVNLITLGALDIFTDQFAKCRYVA